MKKKVCILTATRAEYGLLKNVIERFSKDVNIELKLVVTGMHLSERYGFTYKEIEKDGYSIDRKIPILAEGNDANSISETMGNALVKFSKYFEQIKPDILVVLGDRYETLAVCIAAMNQQVPIAHIHGGEITEGAIDDAIRHSISKMSYLHFTSTEEYKQRVIQLGEEPDRVFCVGALGVENVLLTQLLNIDELQESFLMKMTKKYFVCTFHPVTLENIEVMRMQIDDLLRFAVQHKEYNFIFTKANADVGGQLINEKLDEVSELYDNIFVYASLGRKRYLSALRYSSGVIGNTSSGIIEAPSFKIPTINIGNRQRGRIQAKSIINCEPEYDSLEDALRKLNELIDSDELKSVINPYEKQGTSEMIYNIIVKFLEKGNIELMKKFYDIDVRGIK